MTEVPTTSTEPTTDRSRIRLNLALWLGVLLVAGAAIFLGAKMYDQHQREQAPTVDAGSDVGSGVVQAMDESPASDQQRIADVLVASTKFVNAFTNIDYKTADSTIAAVRSMTTGAFRAQYDKSVKGTKTLLQRLHATYRSEVVYAGYTTGDADSATTVLATQGTVSSDITHKQVAAHNNQIKVDLARSGGRWLVNNVTFIGEGS
ncbi:hypothetical protein [Nocardioides montaniterrae]